MRFGLLAALAILGPALAVAVAPFPLLAQAQAPEEAPALAIGDDELTAYARAYREIVAIRDRTHAELARRTNKNPDAQREIREASRGEIREVLDAHGMTEEEHEGITFLLSVDPDRRARFEEILAELPEPE